MKQLAQSLSNTFGVRTGYTDSKGRRHVTKPKPEPKPVRKVTPKTKP